MNEDRFQHLLRRRFGSRYDEFMQAHDAVAQGGERPSLYAAKNADLDLSLAIASQEFFPIHEAFLTWLVNEFPDPPKRVLDLGCEAGIVTLAIRALWPQTEVVGIDREPAAVEAARTLADRRDFSHSEFQVADIRSLDPVALGKFDLVIGLAVFHEMLEESSQGDPHGHDLFSMDGLPDWDHGEEATLRSLAELLADGGMLIAVSRWAFPEKTLQWVRAMEGAGWGTDFRRSFLLEVRGRQGDSEHLPITVHAPSAHPNPCPLDDVLALHSYPAFRGKAEHLSLEGAAAEALRRGLGEMERVVGYELEYVNGSGTERVEVLASGPLAVLYNSTTNGMRRIVLGSAAFIPDLVRSAVEYVDTRKKFVNAKSLPMEGEARRWAAYGIHSKEEA